MKKREDMKFEKYKHKYAKNEHEVSFYNRTIIFRMIFLMLFF